MLKCVIVEDEFPAREELKFFISNHKNIQLEKEFDNPVDALKYLQENKVDVVFLDINMPELDGMNLGKILIKMDKDLKIVFITAYKDYAAEAFEIKAFDYLLKPYSDIVNLDKITEIESWFNGTYVLKVKDLKFKIPVSRNNIKEFKELLIIK